MNSWSVHNKLDRYQEIVNLFTLNYDDAAVIYLKPLRYRIDRTVQFFTFALDCPRKVSVIFFCQVIIGRQHPSALFIMPTFRKDENGDCERQCCTWSKIVSCSLQTLIINIKKENQKPFIRPKIQLLQLRNSPPVLDTECCSYRYTGTQNTPMLHSCSVEKNLSNREQTFFWQV